MCDPSEKVGSWALEVENSIKFGNDQPRSSPRRRPWISPQTDNDKNATSPINRKSHTTQDHDLRHRLRSRAYGDNYEIPSGSPVRNLCRSSEANHCLNRRDARNSNGPNYRREKDGLSPLRSPLNSDHRSSRLNNSSRRRSIQSQKNDDNSLRSSPSKRNRNSDHSSPQSRPNSNKEEPRFRRRLNLPVHDDFDENAATDSNQQEVDEATLARREKQIQYGKATYSYKMYTETVKRNERIPDRKAHPRTPVKSQKCSRRNWDAQIKAWKKYVHQWAHANGFPTTVGDNDSTSSLATENDSISTGVPALDQDDEPLDLEEEDDISFLEGFDLGEDLKAL